MDDDERVPLVEAGRMFGRAPVSLRSAIRRGRLPSEKIGPVHVVRLADVAAYLADVAAHEPEWATRRRARA